MLWVKVCTWLHLSFRFMRVIQHLNLSRVPNCVSPPQCRARLDILSKPCVSQLTMCRSNYVALVQMKNMTLQCCWMHLRKMDIIRFLYVKWVNKDLPLSGATGFHGWCLQNPAFAFFCIFASTLHQHSAMDDTHKSRWLCNHFHQLWTWDSCRLLLRLLAQEKCLCLHGRGANTASCLLAALRSFCDFDLSHSISGTVIRSYSGLHRQELTICAWTISHLLLLGSQFKRA